MRPRARTPPDAVISNRPVGRGHALTAFLVARRRVQDHHPVRLPRRRSFRRSSRRSRAADFSLLPADADRIPRHRRRRRARFQRVNAAVFFPFRPRIAVRGAVIQNLPRTPSRYAKCPPAPSRCHAAAAAALVRTRPRRGRSHDDDATMKNIEEASSRARARGRRRPRRRRPRAPRERARRRRERFSEDETVRTTPSREVDDARASSRAPGYVPEGKSEERRARAWVNKNEKHARADEPRGTTSRYRHLMLDAD